MPNNNRDIELRKRVWSNLRAQERARMLRKPPTQLTPEPGEPRGEIRQCGICGRNYEDFAYSDGCCSIECYAAYVRTVFAVDDIVTINRAAQAARTAAFTEFKRIFLS